MGIDYDSDCVYGWEIVLGEKECKDKDFVQFLVKNSLIEKQMIDDLTDNNEEEDISICEIVDNFPYGEKKFDLIVVGNHYSENLYLLVGIKLNGKDLDYLTNTLNSIKKEWNLLEDYFTEKAKFLSSYTIC